MKMVHKTDKVSVIQYAGGAIEIERRAVMSPSEATDMAVAITSAAFPFMPTSRPPHSGMPQVDVRKHVNSLCGDGEDD